ncbi:MAG: Uma2 family endonuclease [Candidatus Sericytochromatia bacterium]|nr:Uma2 family endonuclease [Candidatus Sericytochromatia bacterium]
MDVVVAQSRRWTRDEYERLAEQGFFRPDEHLELLDGEILAMTPQKGSHAQAVGLAIETFRQAFGPDAHVRSQLPLALSAETMPEPDVAVVSGSVRDYPAHPTTAMLVMEIADTSLPLDRQRKGPLYARAGIPEYWIVNLVDRIVEVYREPIETADGWHYRLVHRVGPGSDVTPLATGQPVLVDDLLP